jgi:hypothetical protein
VDVEWLIGKVENKMNVRLSKPMLDMEALEGQLMKTT